MLQPALIFLAGALAASAYFLLKTRRNTPYLELDIDSLPPIEEGMATLAGLTSGNVYVGNTVEVFQNGPIFDAMERDIAAAKHTVHFETFVWSQGALEQRIVDLLARKAREGVKVRLLIDAIGGNERNEDRLKALRESGAQVYVYSQVTLFNWRRFNHRTHRKLLICDGVIGYTFGHGVSDLWLGDAHDSKHWRDTGIRITGPAVAGLQTVFMENWIEESHCVPAGEGCFPRLEHTGEIGMHVVSSASGDQVSAVALLYTVALACARREIIIQNPYFAPDDGMCELLATMVKRGVVVHLMVPGTHTDNPFVRRASFALYECLLEGGVRLYEYEHTLLHQKIVIIDGIWSHVGSTNFDSRSLALNEEVGVGFCDRGQAAELRAAFDADLRRSKEVTLQQWRRRPWPAKLVDRAVYQLHDQL
ncbi:MAG: phospholipase D-like domain-containing protein [Steroidobacteraceae bacterium]